MVTLKEQMNKLKELATNEEHDPLKEVLTEIVEDIYLPEISETLGILVEAECYEEIDYFEKIVKYKIFGREE